MYLKKLEIHGFKSFADKTILEFKPGITIVVGPNGSGKSNIADAVRWVLGEQSVKSLRGGKMEDVIFAGSEKRRSLGMAEVSLTMDNSSGIFPLEFNEVTVTRRLYRSGESDYLINRVPCRLRDVHELFMDTGVGREGLSIIGQGKVDEILAVRPEERRGLIEEAAGIVKYRHRKREAVKKLEETDNSLVRLNDILIELSAQQEPLAEQARVAAIFKELKTELDALEIGMIVEEIETNSRRLENTRKSRLKDENELELARTEYHKAQSNEEKHKLLLQKKEEVLAGYQEKIYAENLRLEKCDSERKLISERLADLDRQRRTYKNDIQQLGLELEVLGQEYETHRISGEKLNVLLRQGRDNLKAYEVLLEKENRQDLAMSGELEELKSEHFDTLQEETKVSNEINTLKQRLALLGKQEEHLREKKEHLSKEYALVNSRLEELDREARELASIQSAIDDRMVKLEKEHQLEEQQYRQIQKKNRSLLDEKNNALARHTVLCEMEREGHGYGLGVRELLRLKGAGEFPGLVGTVAQVVTVPKTYELAVEMALGNALQNLITDDETIAEKAVEWLKKNDKGRVTFLPLTTVNGTPQKEHLLSGDGVVGRLSELVQYDRRFTSIMEYLLGRVWLVRDLAVAVRKAKESGFRNRIVTLDGQVVNAGGSITGGSIKTNPSGILNRKRLVKELEQSIYQLDNQLIRGEKEEEEKARVIQDLQREMLALKEKGQELNIKRTENSKSQERWRAEGERYRKEIDSLQWQLSELVQEQDTAKNTLQEYERTAVSIKQRIAGLIQRVNELQELVRSNQAERLKKNEKLTQLRIEVATVEEKITAFEKEHSYLGHRLKQLTSYKQEKEKEAALLKDKKIKLEENQRLLEAEKERQLVLIQQLEKELEKHKNERYNIQEALRQIEQEVKQYSEKIREKEEKIHQYDVQQSRHETSLEALLTRLTEQYGLDWETGKEKGMVIQDRKWAQQRIAELKEEINNLGQVNLSAIEEYSRLTERLTFLTEQVRDMTEAKERLQQVIQEMEQIMTRKFKETFILVDAAFKEMFTRLFGGGRAQLILTQQDNLLEAGVEIIAQPPGKKTQHLSLLSGGEKTLTAIALLMAVLKVKPSPFCVLDEIESNLDEANVVHFAKMIKEFARETQFIIISHRKGTMEIAHVLYGVTIEETGVSSLVSVKLEDIKKEAG